MKARVKATGDIIEVELNHIGDTPVYMDKNGVIYKGLYDLDFDVEEKSLPKDEPDYWEKLKHQYVGMALQGILSNPEQIALYDIDCVAQAVRMADLLINKLKEEEK
jgi:hypothetical protein